MRAVSLCLVLSFCVLGCSEEEPSFELNARRIAELASATCSCSDSVSNKTCTISYEAALNANLVPQVQAGRIQVNGALWADCIDELLACKAPDTCEKLFTGTVAEDGACVASAECAPGFRCIAEDPTDETCSSAGRCEAIEMFERGEACDGFGKCEGDDVCGAKSGGRGQPADAASDEDGGSEPGGDDDAGTGGAPPAVELVCQKPIEKGDPCPIAELGAEGALLCERGTGCVPDDDSVVCGDPVKAGETCAYSQGGVAGFSQCASGNFCSPTSGKCEPFDFPEGGDIGEDCEMRSDCLPGFVCVDDECAAPLPNGSECDDDDQCAAQCFEEQCAPTYVACGIK